MIDWSKLKPYKNDTYRSFEKLCLRIAKALFGDLGTFTPVDDSGGGDGVEFYLTLPTGEQWGWQAKFFYPNPRLSDSNREEQIKASLKKACERHEHLKKWYLCTPTDFSPREKTWFDHTLPQSVPQGRTIEFVHWGDSEFLDWLGQPNFIGVKAYFFGDLELGLDWFRTRCDKQLASVRETKLFKPDLHIRTAIDADIHAFLSDAIFQNYLGKSIKDIKGWLEIHKDSLTPLERFATAHAHRKQALSEILSTAREFQLSVGVAVMPLLMAQGQLLFGQYHKIRLLDWDPDLEQLKQAYDSYERAVRQVGLESPELLDLKRALPNNHKAPPGEESPQVLHELAQSIRLSTQVAEHLMAKFRVVFDELSLTRWSDFHILGDAGVGKTHIASFVCHERLDAGLPAVLIRGNHFTHERPLEEQFRSILDIPPTFSWHDFLEALNAAAEVYETRIPIIIDGLNDTPGNGGPGNIWQRELAGLIQEIEQSPNLAIITTCRDTFREVIWPVPSLPAHVAPATGFHVSEIHAAIKRYFNWYKITADLTDAPLAQFAHPIYLRMFCESRNHERAKEVYAYIGEQTVFAVFEDYLQVANTAVCTRLQRNTKANLLKPLLLKVAGYLWIHQSRSLPLEELTKLVDAEQLEQLSWQASKTKAILDEGLLVHKESDEKGESVSFTYDLLGGYLIALYLLQQESDPIAAIEHSEEISAFLFGRDTQARHPLSQDILRSLTALLPMQTGRYLHEFFESPIALGYSIRALFEVQPDAINPACLDLLTKWFTTSPELRQPLLQRALPTMGHVGHPLNVSFWSTLLKNLSMAERDLSWTEYVRNNALHIIYEILEPFESTSRNRGPLSETGEARHHLVAEWMMWVLTTTVRPLRDTATRALYWYGRRWPMQFKDLVLTSLSINDPYVSERTLAALYGVAMARQHDFTDPSFAATVLPLYGRMLYEAMFQPEAPYPTTHALARDYARHTISIALRHHPTLLTEEEKARMTPPFTSEQVQHWEQRRDSTPDTSQRASTSLPLDVEESMLNQLLSDKGEFPSQTEEADRVRAHILWRMGNLGYTVDAFGGLDQHIVQQHQFGLAEHIGTDQYSQKYAWIAFLELAGVRQDQGILPHDSVRLSADIDPSFPEDIQECQVISTSLLTEQQPSMEEGTFPQNPPDLAPYLIIDELCGEVGPWVLLDGDLYQEDRKQNQELKVYVGSLIVQADQEELVVANLKQGSVHNPMDLLVLEDENIYAGEVPWCETFHFNGWHHLLFENGAQRNLPLTRQSEPRAAKKGGGEIQASSSLLAFKAFIPVRETHWEAPRSFLQESRQVTIPAREVTEYFGLCSQPQTFDLYESVSQLMKKG
jgi:hypothetical protein